MLAGALPCKQLVMGTHEFTQHDGRKKRTAKRLCVKNVAGLLPECLSPLQRPLYIVLCRDPRLKLMFSGLCKNICLKESEVWREVIANKVYRLLSPPVLAWVSGLPKGLGERRFQIGGGGRGEKRKLSPFAPRNVRYSLWHLTWSS